MPVGELFIRTNENDEWVDAYVAYGFSFDESSLSALMTPAPNKAFIENKSRTQHGKVVTRTEPKVDERSLTLSFNLTAKDKDKFMERYWALCDLLEVGYIELKTKYTKHKDGTPVVYKMIYGGCSQFSQFRQSIGKFALKLNEPNPKDRR